MTTPWPTSTSSIAARPIWWSPPVSARPSSSRPTISSTRSRRSSKSAPNSPSRPTDLSARFASNKSIHLQGVPADALSFFPADPLNPFLARGSHDLGGFANRAFLLDEFANCESNGNEASLARYQPEEAARSAQRTYRPRRASACLGAHRQHSAVDEPRAP